MGLFADNAHLDQPAFYTMAALDLYKSSSLKYGKSPFLYPRYGLSEIPQGFSRLCALSGGVQSLRVGIEDLLMDPETKKVAGLVVKYDGEVMAVKTSRIVASPEYFQNKGPLQSDTKMTSVGKVVRSICIIDHPIKGTAAAHQAVQLILPQKQTGRKRYLHHKYGRYI